jgi:hypothetical protein
LCAASFRDGVDYNLAYIGPDFTVEPRESLSRLTCERCSTTAINGDALCGTALLKRYLDRIAGRKRLLA